MATNSPPLDEMPSEAVPLDAVAPLAPRATIWRVAPGMKLNSSITQDLVLAECMMEFMVQLHDSRERGGRMLAEALLGTLPLLFMIVFFFFVTLA